MKPEKNKTSQARAADKQNVWEKSVFTKTKVVASNQTNSVFANLKLLTWSLKTITQNKKDDFPYTGPKFGTMIPVANQNKQSPFTSALHNISNPNLKTINQTPCLSLASKSNNKSETSIIAATDAFIDKLIRGKETVLTEDSQADDII